jgi:uncharacterized membrane protein YdjX (TVP38/TMEM64 family)
VTPGAARGSPPTRLRRAARLAALVLITLGAAAAWHWRSALDPTAVAAAIGHYPAAPLVFLVVHVAASLFFVPRTILAIAAGVLFGMSWGVFWAALGSVVGAVAGFLVARYLGAGLVDRQRDRRLRQLSESVGSGGWRPVAALRLIPIMPHSLANYLFGLTRLGLAAYAFGSFVGQLPMTIACVDLGAAGERLMLGRPDWLAPTLIGATALALSLLIPIAVRRRGISAER